MRLCFISNPNSIHTRRWVNWFAQHGHTVCVVADIEQVEPWAGMEVIDLSKMFYAPVVRFPVWEIYLRKIIKSWQPDILHAHRVNSAGWLASFSGFHPYVVTPWGSDVLIHPQRSAVARILASYTLKRADLITIISKTVGEQVKKLGGRPERMEAVRWGIEMEVFNPNPLTPVTREGLLKRLSLPAEARVIFCPRAIAPVYNCDIILQAVPAVRERFPGVVFVFTEFNVDRETKKQLDALSKKLELDAAMRWIPPLNSREEMADLYHLSEAVVSVPSSDSLAISVQEAMACGKPVVCTDLPALREIIIPKTNGYLVPVRQADPLAEAVIEILSDPAKAQAIGRAAHETISNIASLDVEMGRMERIYHRLIDSKNR